MYIGLVTTHIGGSHHTLAVVIIVVANTCTNGIVLPEYVKVPDCREPNMFVVSFFFLYFPYIFLDLIQSVSHRL